MCMCICVHNDIKHMQIESFYIFVLKYYCNLYEMLQFITPNIYYVKIYFVCYRQNTSSFCIYIHDVLKIIYFQLKLFSKLYFIFYQFDCLGNLHCIVSDLFSGLLCFYHLSLVSLFPFFLCSSYFRPVKQVLLLLLYFSPMVVFVINSFTFLQCYQVSSLTSLVSNVLKVAHLSL